MRAILLAAGFGSRLGQLTASTPKCLLPVAGKPLLEIWLDHLHASGAGPFLVNTHYLADQVAASVAASRHKADVTLSHEDRLLGTAGTLFRNRLFYEGNGGLLIHADNYCLADLPAFFAAHAARPAGCVMTMMTFRTPKPETCGIVQLDRQGVVTGFQEKVPSPDSNLANGAIYMLADSFFEETAAYADKAVDVSLDVIPRLLGKIYTCETGRPLVDIGTPDTYEYANKIAQ